MSKQYKHFMQHKQLDKQGKKAWKQKHRKAEEITKEAGALESVFFLVTDSLHMSRDSAGKSILPLYGL